METDWSDFSWLVGLLEGEGTVRPHIRMGYYYAYIKIEMSCRDVIERAFRIAGIGNMYGPYKSRNPERPMWAWKVSGDAAIDFLEKVLPYVGEKKRQEIKESLPRFVDSRERGRVALVKSNARRKGIEFTEEHKAKLSAAARSRKRG